MMKKLSFALICVSTTWSLQTLAETPAIPTPPTVATSPAPDMNDKEVREKFNKRCQEDSKWCEDVKVDIKKRREARKQWCTANPEACKKEQEEMNTLKEKCKESPEKCAALRHEVKQKLSKQKQDVQQKWCDSNPQRCEAWKAEQNKIEEQCREARRQLQEKYSDRPLP
jgi:hypothetical protein